MVQRTLKNRQIWEENEEEKIRNPNFRVPDPALQSRY